MGPGHVVAGVEAGINPPREGKLHPMGIECRGNLLVGRLQRYPQADNCLEVSPGGWGAMPYAVIRVAVAGPGQSSEVAGCVPDDGEDEPARVCVDEVLSEPALPREGAAVAVNEEIAGGLTGGSADRAAAPIVLIDLEAGVMVQEVDSDREGIPPSAWNQTRFVVNEEGVAASADYRPWVPFVDSRRLRPVLQSLYCEGLLQRLEFSPVSGEESLEAPVDLVGEIQEVYDRQPAREPWKKQVVSDILVKVYPVTHVRVVQLKDLLRSATCAQLMRRLGLPLLEGDEGRQSLSPRVIEIRDIHEDEDSAPWKIRLMRRLLAQIRELVPDVGGVERSEGQPPGSQLVTHD